jgi:hypothetical protein
LKKLLTLVGALLLLSLVLCLHTVAQPAEQSPEIIKAMDRLARTAKPNFYEIQKTYGEYFNSIPEGVKKSVNQYKRWENFWRARVDQDGNFPNPLILIDELKKLQTAPAIPNPTDSYQWNVVGPTATAASFTDSHSKGLGRVNIVRLDPTNENTIWIGMASGGVAKSTDGGVHWQHFEFTSSLSLGIADIAISPSNPNVVYVATGDCEQASDKMFYSVGVIKTTDGGEHWDFTNLAYYLNDQRNL